MVIRVSLLSLVLSVPLAAATYTVTTTADAGPGSLRQGLLEAASGSCATPCTIEFHIVTRTDTAVHTITPESPLPDITADQTILDARTQTLVENRNPFGPEVEISGEKAGSRSGLRLIGVDRAAVHGLVINQFPGHGIFIDGGSDNRIAGNYIGTSASGFQAGNDLHGIAIRNAVSTIVEDNVISGNDLSGVYVEGAAGTILRRNRVGVTPHDRTAVPNHAHGIHFFNSRDSVVEANVIAGNEGNGILLAGVSRFNAFLRNEIERNGLLGIDLGGDGPDAIDPGDLDEGPNSRTNAPTLSTATSNCQSDTVLGRMVGAANTAYRIELFGHKPADASGSASTFFLAAGTATTDAGGSATFGISVPGNTAAGSISATATSAHHETSELSASIPLLPPCTDLGLEVFPGREIVNVGASIGFTVRVTNHGPRQSGERRMTLRFSEAVQLDGAPGCTPVSSREFSCRIPPLPYQDFSRFHDIFMVARLEARPTTLLATATLLPSSDAPDPNPVNDTASASSSSSALPDVRVFTSAVGAEPWDPGDSIFWSFEVWNEGASAARNVTLTFETDPAVPLEGLIAGTLWSCMPEGQTLVCRHPRIEVQSIVTPLQIRGVAPDSGRLPSLNSRVTVSTPDGDYDPRNNTLQFPTRLYLARFVTNIQDSGAGSLRAAMSEIQTEDCNGNTQCKVMFRIPVEQSQFGIFTIRPLSPLPRITGDHIILDGTTQTRHTSNSNPAGPEVEISGYHSTPGNGIEIVGANIFYTQIWNLVINGWPGHGVLIRSDGNPEATTQNVIRGSYVGTDATGTVAIPNQGHGIFIERGGSMITVGGHSNFCASADGRDCHGNVISGNGGDGINVAGNSLNLSLTNIGLQRDGRSPLPNGGSGVAFVNGHRRSGLFRSNIAYNRGDGIRYEVDSGAAELTMVSIANNGGLGIDHGGDGVDPIDVPDSDGRLNAPEITRARYDASSNRTVIGIRIFGAAPLPRTESMSVALFANSAPDPSGYGEGERPLDAQFSASSEGELEMFVPGNLTGSWITAVASRYVQLFPDLPRMLLASSEFSRAVLVE